MSVGRGVWFRKTCVEECFSLDVTMLARKGGLKKKGFQVITHKRTFGSNMLTMICVAPPDELRLIHSLMDQRTGEIKKLTRWVILDFTDCHFGGQRPWFICPGCDRRCRMIYLVGNSEWWTCRVCSNLTYRSQQESSSVLVRCIRSMMDYEDIARRYNRARSPKTRAKLKRKLDRIESMMLGFVGKYGP